MLTVESVVNVIINEVSHLTRLAEINAQIARLQAERESEMPEGRVAVLASMKTDTRLYDLKTTGFEGVPGTRETRGNGAATEISATKKFKRKFL